jgi:excinuclease ABC subunit B
MIKQPFILESKFQPAGDQPFAIQQLIEGFQNKQEQILLGVTGSGKTFTMANCIQHFQKKTLILAPNKTLAAQLYFEFKEFFPHNAVEYFISYYDYYRPESFLPAQNIFIEKEATINTQIEKMRHSATASLFEREDVIIVASVSCIYGLGSPEEYTKNRKTLFINDQYSKEDIIDFLINLQYERVLEKPKRGNFFILGNSIDLYLSSEEDSFVRIDILGGKIFKLSFINSLTQKPIKSLEFLTIYPMSHYLVSKEQIAKAVISIEAELETRLFDLKDKELEYNRLKSRTLLDLALLKEIGFCRGIENYSRHLTGLEPGESPYTLLDYFGKDFFLIIDESHLSIPQVRGMYAGDRARKTTLVAHGFRLPSALDNRPLNFQEFEKKLPQTLYVSATPGPYELHKLNNHYVEQIQRPTGLLDPILEVHPAKEQIALMLQKAKEVILKNQRVLITTTTKKLSEQISTFFEKSGIKSTYLHSEIGALDRIEVLKKLRTGTVDVLIGINLLREGLDLPEVSLVGILDADKEGFLRSTTSLIQTIGRAARHHEGKVLLFADKMTESLKNVIEITANRRKKQEEFNALHNITIQTIEKSKPMEFLDNISLQELEFQLQEAVKSLNFKEAAKIRDKIKSQAFNTVF